MDGVDSRISPVGLDREYSRRNFLKTAAIAGAAAAAGAGGLALAARPAFAVHEGYQAVGDVAIFQLVYKLELLEVTFYDIGAASGLFSGNDLAQIAQIRDHEFTHADAIAATLAAAGAEVPATPEFIFPDDYLNDAATFLGYAATFEPVGIGAYQGAAPALVDKNLLASAISIHNAECQHRCAIDILRGIDPPNNVAFEVALPLEDVLAAVAPFGITA